MSALKVCPQCGTEYPANARFCEIDGTALRSPSSGTDLVGSIVADRYHILRKIGEGGMGQVYLAEHVKMGRKSALKVMHRGMKADVVAISRFNREAANAARISHSNVVAVYDFGETPDGVIYLAMEFVDGPPLTDVVRAEGALAAKRVAEIVRQIAEALEVAHDMGIVHRDLKPDNIMIAKNRDGSDWVKVVDFGISKAAGNSAQKVTKTGLIVGTPDYMSPEQLAGDKLDGRSDVYSLGLVAYNMLTGTLPFTSDSTQESMIMRITDKPRALGEVRPDIAWSADVEGVMSKALERDMVQRYQSATEFASALTQAVRTMPDAPAKPAGTFVLSTPPVGRSPARSDAIPPTRVAPAIVTSAPDDASVGSTKGRGLAWFAAAAAVLVTAAVAFTMRGGRSVTPDTSAAAPSKPVAAPVSAASNINYEDSLVGLLDSLRIPARAGDVLIKVNTLKPLLKSSRELMLAATVESKAVAAQGDTAKACQILKDVMPNLNAGDRADASDKLPRFGCQP